jgi:hypothetical protein
MTLAGVYLTGYEEKELFIKHKVGRLTLSVDFH